VRRKIALHPSKAELTIETTYEKVQGPRVRVAVWTITQLDPPQSMIVELPDAPTFAGGFRSLLPAEPRNLSLHGNFLTLDRDTAAKTMIATESDKLTWRGEDPEPLFLTIENASPGPPGSIYPEGVHSQIYTSPDDAQPYVELELVGPLHDLSPGQSASLTSRYTLVRERIVPLGR
jgi:hypothetical protein